MNDRRPLKVLDLFSGIGGFSLGLERTGGFETVAFCEIEGYPRRVLKKHWPGVPVFEDVRKLNAKEIKGSVDVICGGYPCQPFSVAGKRRGEKDDRHLWPEMFRLVRECRPTWVIAENVAGHISMGLDHVLSDLEGEGYSCRAFVIPACAVDAPHRRDRVWILAHTAGGSKQPSGSQCDVGGLQKEVLQAGRSADHFKVEPTSDRVADGVPRRVDRIRCLGNAVVPQIPEMLGRAILSL